MPNGKPTPKKRISRLLRLPAIVCAGLLSVVGITLASLDGWLLLGTASESEPPNTPIYASSENEHDDIDAIGVIIDLEDVPEWVPLYPEATHTEGGVVLASVGDHWPASEASVDATRGGRVVIKTSHDPGIVKNYYEDLLKQDGYDITTGVMNSDGLHTTNYLSARNENIGRTIEIRIETSLDEYLTELSLDYEEVEQ